jgi:hypothetical protein
MFSTPSRTRINHLRGALNNTKKGTMTTDQFFAKMKGFSSELVAAGKPVEDDEMIGYILNGLDSSYNDLVSSVNGNPHTTLDDVYGQINSHDLRRDMLVESGQEEAFQSSANAANKRRDDRYRGNSGRSPDHGDRGDHDRGYYRDRYREDRHRDDDGGRRRDYYDNGKHRDDYYDNGKHRDDDGGRRHHDNDGGHRHFDDGNRRRDDGDRRRNDGARKDDGG